MVFEAGTADAARLAQALGLSRYEAEQRRRRGGVQLDRVSAPDDAERRAVSLREAGLLAHAIPESETRAARAPRVARGGRRESEALQLRLASGTLTVLAKEPRLVVRGPIAREYQVRDSARHQVRTATVEPGYRFHLHLLDGVPVEIDPWSFEMLGGSPPGSTLLAISEWIGALFGHAIDDGFRWLSPALAPETASDGAVGAAALVRPKTKGGKNEAVVLDNLAQFRLYSGWRGAFEARRAR